MTPATARPRESGDPDTISTPRWVPAFAGPSGVVVLAALLLIAGISPSWATGTVDCEAADGAASLSLTIGSLPVLGVVHMEVTAGDRTWSTGDGGDIAISIGQAFSDGDRWLIDATDPNIEAIVAEVRLNQAAEEGDVALAGTLKIPGTGAWAVTCIGP